VHRSRDRVSLAQTVETPLSDERLFNLHLDSRVNPDQRLAQPSIAIEAAEPETRPVVIDIRCPLKRRMVLDSTVQRV
jgi:hypothetical protein